MHETKLGRDEKSAKNTELEEEIVEAGRVFTGEDLSAHVGVEVMVGTISKRGIPKSLHRECK